jgi:hypothetical protein
MAGSGSKGGGQPQQPFNVNQYAAQGLQNAMDATNMAIATPLSDDFYMNPYMDEVVENTQQDIERQRQMAINSLGAQAQGAGAYGGSRMGVAEGVTNAEYGRMAANALGNLRMAGYNQAMNDRSGRLAAAQQLGNLSGGAFNASRAITSDMLNQGLLQQASQQALIDAARGDFTNYVNAPANSLQMPLAALGASPKPMSTTNTQNPGLLGTLGALKYMMPGGTIV